MDCNEKKQLVVKDNALINATYRLDLTELRLILMSTVRARESGMGISPGRPLYVRAEDYSEQFKVTRQASYMALRAAAKGLFERQFSYVQSTESGDREIVHSRWVSRISYAESSGRVSIIFAPDVVQLITRLEKEFTSYELEQISGLSSSYAMRLYELLASWRRLGKTPEIELDDLKNRLGVSPGEYDDIQNFKRRVLDLALRQINKHTDLAVKYQQHKQGRRIVGFSFTFKLKKAELEQNRDPNTLDWVNGKTDSAPPDKPKRRVISKVQAEAMARPGEDYSELYRRLSRDFSIK